MKNNYFWNSQKFAIREIRKIPYENPTFFPRRALPKIFLLYTLSTLVILHTAFGLIWTTPLPDEKNLFLKFLFREIRKIPYENPIFFRGQLYQFFCFTLSLHWWYSIPRLVWFGQLLNPMKKNCFWNSQKFAIREIRKIPYGNPTFSWTRSTKIFFALHSHYTGDTPYRVWFDLDNSLTRWKKVKILKNSQFAKFAKFRMNTQLFPRRALPKIFLLYSLVTLVILHTAFGLIWTTR